MVAPGCLRKPARRRASSWALLAVALTLGMPTIALAAGQAPSTSIERFEPMSPGSAAAPQPGLDGAGGGLMVLLLVAGFALQSAGHCRSKNAAHAMVASLGALCVAMLAFGACGYAISAGYGSPPASISLFGRSFGLIGTEGFWLRDLPKHPEHAGAFLTLAAFAAVSATIPTGALAERWRFGSLSAATIVIAGLIFPVFACWTWSGGWLAASGWPRTGHGFRDFAGSGVVHLVGGISALAGALAIGPRIGKYSDEGQPRVIPGHDLTYVIIGTLLIAAGWCWLAVSRAAAVPGASTALTAVSLLLAGSAGCVSAAVASRISYGKPDPTFACNGLLGGLVAISGLGGWAEPFAAVLVGASAGVLSFWSALFVERVPRVDDPAGAISVHGVCGAFGCLCVGLFADGGGSASAPLGLFFDGGISQLVAQLTGVVAAVVWVFPASWLTFRLIGWTIGNRATARAEVEGLDLFEVGAHAYMVEEPVALQAAGLDHLRSQGPGVPPSRSTKSKPGPNRPRSDHA